MAEHLASVCQPSPSERPAHHAHFEEEVTRILSSPARPLHFVFMKKKIGKLKVKKAPGIDEKWQVTNGTLRYLDMTSSMDHRHTYQALRSSCRYSYHLLHVQKNNLASFEIPPA